MKEILTELYFLIVVPYTAYTVVVQGATNAGLSDPVPQVIYTRQGRKTRTPSCMLLHSSKMLFAAPNVPAINTVARLSGPNGIISWNSITPANARGFLTSIELAYEPSERTGSNECPSLDSSKHVVSFRDDMFNLYEISSYSIPDLIPDEEYCVAIQASTSAGSSGYSGPTRMSCELELSKF